MSGFQQIPAYTTVSQVDRKIFVQALHAGPGGEYAPGPNVTIAKLVSDPGNVPTTRVRRGFSLVKNSADGKFYAATDPVNGDRCTPATIIGLEQGSAAWNNLVLTFSAEGGPAFTVQLGGGTATVDAAVADLLGSVPFVVLLTADKDGAGNLRIRTRDGGAGSYFTAYAAARPQLFGPAPGLSAHGTDPDYYVTTADVDLLDPNNAPIDGFVAVARVGYFVEANLIGLTDEMRAVLSRRGAQFG